MLLTTPPAIGYSPRTPKTRAKPVGSESSPPTFAPCRSTESSVPAPILFRKEIKPGGSSTTKLPTPTVSIRPLHCPSCAQPSRPNCWFTLKSCANYTAQTHVSAPAFTIRACCYSIGGRFNPSALNQLTPNLA